MKKIFIYLITFYFVFNVSIAKDRNFKLIGESVSARFFLDLNSVKQTNNDTKLSDFEIKYIQLVSFEKPQTLNTGKRFHSMQIYQRGRCIGIQSKIYRLQYYEKKMHDGDVMKGDIVKTLMNVKKDWKTEKEGSAGYSVLMRACGQIIGKGIRDAGKEFHERNKKKN